MNEIIEIKRKEYEIIEQIGERSFKVERKGQLFFMKNFGDDQKGFEEFVDAEHKLRVSGVTNPKCYLYDKKIRIAIIAQFQLVLTSIILLAEAFAHGRQLMQVVSLGEYRVYLTV